jgi:hypothetical protein
LDRKDIDIAKFGIIHEGPLSEENLTGMAGFTDAKNRRRAFGPVLKKRSSFKQLQDSGMIKVWF